MTLPALKSVVVTGDLDPVVSVAITGDATDEASAKNLADVVRGLVAMVSMQGGQKPELKQLASAVSVTTDAQFDISGRPKSIFSIWKKMQAKNVPFEEIYDVLAVRIVFEPVPGIPEKTQCWNIYSIITDSYLPKPDRLRDWVSRPKPNGYEALHVTVMGPEGQWVEVQIQKQTDG